MNCQSNIHWNKESSNVLMDINLNKPGKIISELNNSAGKCIKHLLNRKFKKGTHHIEKSVNKINTGIYTIKINSDEECSIIRFIID